MVVRAAGVENVKTVVAPGSNGLKKTKVSIACGPQSTVNWIGTGPSSV